ncbi:MAG TPA: R3H domain-containing nucleic acid-binding protein [Chthonomonadaceae bacterium]|nr:R3H domain-containing nucleic acid-binding protein [Chthonomonadaceae bacterium]
MKTQPLTAQRTPAADAADSASPLNAPEIAPENRPPLTAHQQRVTDNLTQLLDVLPPPLRAHLEAEDSLEDLLEIVMDLGRIPEARFPERVVELGDEPIAWGDLEYVVGRVGAFGKDNRAGIERTLHRISAIRNRQGRIVGLTCRIGRAVYGTIDIIQDVVESGKSILLLGRPGRGKTTKLREVARVLSEELKKRVVIVDTSNEIAGDGDIPHPGIGRARRMQVATPEEQHSVMIEAVENHMPEVIVIDEIGTEQEAFAARTIAERGVQLVGTAHGNSLENLMMNPTLSDLVGGIHAVTLSDDEAKRRGTQKTVLERKAPPTFDVIIEIMEVDKLAIHLDVEKTVDRLLRGMPPRPEIRVRNDEGEIEIVQRSEDAGPTIREILDREYPNKGRGPRADREARQRIERIDRMAGPTPDRLPRSAPPEEEETDEDAEAERTPSRFTAGGAPVTKPLPSTVRIFPYGVSRSRLDRAIAESRVPAYIARDVTDADVVLALKATYKKEPGKMREAAQRRLPVYVVRSNSITQIAGGIREIFGLGPERAPESAEDTMEAALQEAQDAIEMVQQTHEPIELAPANSYTRRLQHQLIERYQLASESVGVEPRRRVRILPKGA